MSAPLSICKPLGDGTTSACTRAAAMIMHALCRKNETARVPRALGFMDRVLAKTKHPTRKEDIEVRDFSQP